MKIRINVNGVAEYVTASRQGSVKETADALYDAIDQATKLQFTLEDGRELVLGPGILQRCFFIVEE